MQPYFQDRAGAPWLVSCARRGRRPCCISPSNELLHSLHSRASKRLVVLTVHAYCVGVAKRVEPEAFRWPILPVLCNCACFSGGCHIPASDHLASRRCSSMADCNVPRSCSRRLGTKRSGDQLRWRLGDDEGPECGESSLLPEADNRGLLRW
jgi:hypothetical protein